MLHNFLNYVNKCYQIHNRLCSKLLYIGIFCGGVYIKNIIIIFEKLSKLAEKAKRLDFLKIFVIMSAQSRMGLSFCNYLIPLLFVSGTLFAI